MNNERITKELQMGKINKKEFKGYTEQALAYFQEQNDQDEFMTEPVNGDYIDYLLGDTEGGYSGEDMVQEFDELNDDSDWYMD